MNGDFPELYDTDLITLSKLLGCVEHIAQAHPEDITDVEIRVQLYGSDFWVVMGYGSAGDPCIRRFEKD